jgi:hypothetical protein
VDQAEHEIVTLVPHGAERPADRVSVGLNLAESVVVGSDQLREHVAGVRRLQALCQRGRDQCVRRDDLTHAQIGQRLSHRRGTNQGGRLQARRELADQHRADEHVAV